MENENNNVPNTTDQVSAMDAVSNTLEQPAEPEIGVIPADASAEATPVAPETPAEPVPVEGTPVEEPVPIEAAPVEEPVPVEGAPVEVGVVNPDGTEAPVEAPKKSKLPLIIGIVVALIAVGVAVYFLFLKKDEEEPVENTTKPVENTTTEPEETLEDLIADYLTYLGEGYMTAAAADVEGDKTKDEKGTECKSITYEDLAAMKKANEANETNATEANTTETNETNETASDAKTGDTGYYACKKAPEPEDSVAITNKPTKDKDKIIEYDHTYELKVSCTSALKDVKCEEKLKWETQAGAEVSDKGVVKNTNTTGKDVQVTITVKYAEKSDTVTFTMKPKPEEKPAETNTTTQPETPTTPEPDYSSCGTADSMSDKNRGKLADHLYDWTLKYVDDHCPTLEELKTAVANEAGKWASEKGCSETVINKAKEEAITGVPDNPDINYLMKPSNLETLRGKYGEGRTCAGHTFD